MDVTHRHFSFTSCFYVLDVLWLFISQTAATCTFPANLRGKWDYTYPTINKIFPLDFGESTVTGFDYRALGDALKQYTCITNTSDIYILRSDSAYTDQGQNRYLFLCMKMTEVSENLFYYYLLGDELSSVSDRVFSPPIGSPIPNNPLPTACDYCSYSTDPPDDDYRLLQREGTNEQLASNVTVCLPCNATCETAAECPFPEAVDYTTNVTTGNTPTDTIAYTCVNGYENTAGDMTRTCSDDGTWSGTPPICSPVSCGPLVEVDEATNTSTGSSFGDTITYTCNTGYERTSGDLTRNCQANGKWSGSAPVCSPVSCMTLDDVANQGTKTSTGTTFGKTTTYTCKNGYERTSGDLTRTCQADKKWSGSAPVCSPVSCGPLADVDNATKKSTGTSFGQTTTYTCDNGFENTVGNLKRTCQANKNWDGMAPVCSHVSCGPLGEINQAQKVSTGTTFGETTTYTCNNGYEQTAGNLTRTCQADKQWDGTVPECSKVSCGPLDDISQATKTSTGSGSVFEDTTTYTCINGYERTAGTLTRTCQATGNWDGSDPVCSRISCGTLGEVNHASKSSTGILFQDTTTYSCLTGYEKTSGDMSRTCQANKNWSGTQPVCSPVSCGSLGSVSGASESQTGIVYTDTTTYVCKTNYEYFSGNLVRTCQANGIWSGIPPVCYYVPPTSNEQVSMYVAGVIAGSILLSGIILYICIFCKLMNRTVNKNNIPKRSRAYKS